MAEITFDDWKRLEMVVGKIASVERVPKTDKLYRLMVDVGKEESVQIVTSLVDYYTEKELQDKLIIVLTNLKPAKFGGEMSNGMLLCAEKDDKCVLLAPEKDLEPGAVIT